MADIYEAKSDKAKRRSIGLDVSGKADLLAYVAEHGRVDLKDVDAVRRRAELFMKRCEEQGAIPTLMGLCVALGIARRTLYQHLERHPNGATAQYIDVLRDVFADVLAQAALRRDTSDAMSIFILKNTASMSDNVRIEAFNGGGHSALGDYVDEEELKARIAASVVVEEDD